VKPVYGDRITVEELRKLEREAAEQVRAQFAALWRRDNKEKKE